MGSGGGGGSSAVELLVVGGRGRGLEEELDELDELDELELVEDELDLTLSESWSGWACAAGVSRLS